MPPQSDAPTGHHGAPIVTDRIFAIGEELPPAPRGFEYAACDLDGGCRLRRARSDAQLSDGAARMRAARDALVRELTRQERRVYALSSGRAGHARGGAIDVTCGAALGARRRTPRARAAARSRVARRSRSTRRPGPGDESGEGEPDPPAGGVGPDHPALAARGSVR